MTATLDEPVAARRAPGATGRRGLRHIGALDGLRGAAVAGVLLFHGGHLSGGYLGVDLFFVLSGYLITLLLLTEWRGSRRIRLGNFWTRRARRLFPALIVALLGVALYAHVVASPEELNGIRADGFATLFYVANWHSIFVGQNYFQAGLAPSPLEHTWSLAIEEQFYLVWPLVVLGLLKLRDRPTTILRAALALAAGSVGLMVVLHATGAASDNSLYLGTHTRIAAIAMGAALAAWQVAYGHTRTRANRVSLEALAIVAVVFLGVAWSMTDLQTGLIYSGGLAACGLAVTAVIASATHPEPMVVNRVLSFAPLRWLGLISYGLYLYHWPIYLYLDHERTGLSSWPLLGLQTFVALDVAVLSYFLLERPIRYGALKGWSAELAAPIAAVVTALALVAGTAGGVSAITQQQTGSVADPHAQVFASSKPGSQRLLITGDSVPLVLGTEGVQPIVDELGVTVIDAGVIGCSPMVTEGTIIDTPNGRVDRVKRDCTNRDQALVRKYKPDAVMLLYGALNNYKVDLRGKLRGQCDSTYESVFERRLRLEVDQLSTGGAPVVLVTKPGTDDPRVLDLFSLPNAMALANCENDVIRKVYRDDHRTRLVDLAGYICPRDHCIGQKNGTKLRSDGVHYRGKNAEFVARWLIPKVMAAARTKR